MIKTLMIPKVPRMKKVEIEVTIPIIIDVTAQIDRSSVTGYKTFNGLK